MPRATKVNAASIRPYARGSSPEDHLSDTLPSAQPVKTSKKGGGASKGGQGGYNKTLLVSLVFAPAKPDWGPIAHDLNKTPTQCFDIWRKVLLPNLLANKPWAGGSTTWSVDEKILLLTKVLAQLKLSWEDVAVHFPGKSKSQVCDVWRKVILPRLKRGDTVE